MGEPARRLFRHHDFLFLQQAPPRLAGAESPIDLQEFERFEPEVIVINDTLRRGFPEGRLRLRFERGLRFYALREGGRVVASTWLVQPGGQEFIDEGGIGLKMDHDAASIRDAFVVADRRGRGLFPRLVAAAAARIGGLSALWSVVDRSNTPSLRAHFRAGFEPLDRLQVVHLAGALLIRLRWPGRIPRGTVYAEGRRLVFTGRSYQDFRARHLA